MPPKGWAEPQPVGSSGGPVQGSAFGGWKDRDPPPPYDGKQPDKTFDRWMKELRLWEFETEIPKEQWGVKILRQLSGTARAAADSLSFEDLACESGRDNLIKALKEHFAPHLESSLPRAFEEAVYGDVRSSRETFGEFVIRMEHAFKELERQGVKLGDVVLGYVLFRGANLSEAQENQMLTWGEGKYDHSTVVKGLRRLDKNIHEGKKKSAAYLMNELGEQDGDEPEEEIQETYLEAQEDSDDEDYVYIGEGEMQEIFDEEHVQEALATYQDVRKSLRDQKNSRGYYPQPSGRGASPPGRKGKGRGKDSRPTLAFKGKNRDYVKFTKNGTKIHVDMLKLRTRCARCGAIGHWAKECRNPPDERGKAAAAMRSASSAPSSQNGRSGFFVKSEGEASPQTFMTRRCESEESSERSFSLNFMSYMPTFGKFLQNAMCRRELDDAGEIADVNDVPPPSFAGDTTCPSQGVVDTAAQDGLIGKAALLRLIGSLREHGLKVNWNKTKKAQACGVGGKAQVIGIAEVPLGIAGVSGLMELTVIADDVPLLLPIKLLKQLKAVVDLDQNVLEFKAYDVKAPLVSLPSGHVSVGVTEFAPGGWKLPSEAVEANLQSQKFTLANSGFMNHSMIALETFVDYPSSASSRHGVASFGADAIAEGGGQRSPTKGRGGCGKEQAGGSSVAADWREAGRAYETSKPSSKGSKLASKFLVAALGVQAIAGGPISFYPKCVLNSREDQGYGHPAGVCRGDQVYGLPWCQAEQGKAFSGDIRMQASNDGVEGCWESVSARDLLQPLQRPLGTSDPGGVEEPQRSSEKPGEPSVDQSLHECRSDGRCDQVLVRQASLPLGGEEGTDAGKTLFPVPKPRGRVCDFFQWDPTEQQQAKERMEIEEENAEKFQEEILKIQSQAEGHINHQAQEMQRMMKIQTEQMEQDYQNRMEAQSSQHQQELAEMKAQMAWMQGFLAQIQASQAAQSDGFSLVSDPSVWRDSQKELSRNR